MEPSWIVWKVGLYEYPPYVIYDNVDIDLSAKSSLDIGPRGDDDNTNCFRVPIPSTVDSLSRKRFTGKLIEQWNQVLLRYRLAHPNQVLRIEYIPFASFEALRDAVQFHTIDVALTPIPSIWKPGGQPLVVVPSSTNVARPVESLPRPLFLSLYPMGQDFLSIVQLRKHAHLSLYRVLCRTLQNHRRPLLEAMGWAVFLTLIIYWLEKRHANRRVFAGLSKSKPAMPMYQQDLEHVPSDALSHRQSVESQNAPIPAASSSETDSLGDHDLTVWETLRWAMLVTTNCSTLIPWNHILSKVISTFVIVFSSLFVAIYFKFIRDEFLHEYNSLNAFNFSAVHQKHVGVVAHSQADHYITWLEHSHRISLASLQRFATEREALFHLHSVHQNASSQPMLDVVVGQHQSLMWNLSQYRHCFQRHYGVSNNRVEPHFLSVQIAVGKKSGLSPQVAIELNELFQTTGQSELLER